MSKKYGGKTAIDYYLNEIQSIKWIEFDCIEVHDIKGDIRKEVDSDWWWVAKCKPRPGDDDPYTGEGFTLLSALVSLHDALMDDQENPA